MFSKRPSARIALHGVPAMRERRRSRRTMRQASPPSIDEMRLVPHDRGWALKVDDISEPAWVVSTKKNALASAKENARFHGATLRVLTRAGKVQKTLDFGGAHAS